MSSAGAAANPAPQDAGLPPPDPLLDTPTSNVFTNINITTNQVSDQQLLTGLWFNAILGAVCFIAFCFLQRSAFPRHYRHRLVSPSVTVKPRPLPTRGWSSLWQWLVNAVVTPEKEILSSAGLDAVVMTWCLKIGIALFLPMAIIGCALLIPVHYAAYRANVPLQEDSSVNRSQLMRLTIASVPFRSPIAWLHFVLVVLYNVYAMCILFFHFRRYVIIRHSYLTRGDDPNYWMALTHQADAKNISRKVRRILLDLNLASEVGAKPVGSPGHADGALGAAGGAPGSGGGAGGSGGGGASDGAAGAASVMSSIRSLGVGISRLFAPASERSGAPSRAASLTPSEAPTPATASLAAGASLGGGGGGSGPGSSAAATPAALPSPVSSVLGASPSTLSARLRLIRQPLLGQLPGPPPMAAPPQQEMAADGRGGGAEAVVSPGDIAITLGPLPSPGAGSGAGGGGADGGAAQQQDAAVAAAAAHHAHGYRVAHMRTITEENLDAMLARPASSDGPGGSAAGGLGAPSSTEGTPPRPGVLAAAAAAATTAPAAPASPFASCSGIAGGIAKGGVSAEAGAAAAAAAAAAPVGALSARVGAGAAAPPAVVRYPSGGSAGTGVGPGDIRLTVASPPGGRGSGSDGGSGGGFDGWGAADEETGHHATTDARRVAYHWWKALPEESVQKPASSAASDLDGYEEWREQPLLAKPSVRFRKTINADNPAYRPYGAGGRCNERPKVAVNAQHYAVLVTDVAQWPYPELQRAYEANRRPTFGERFLSALSALPQILGRPDAAVKHLLRRRATRGGAAAAGGPAALAEDGAAGGGGASSDDSSLLPLSVRRSIELAQGSGLLHGPLGLRGEPHATDDLEAAAETIEHAKAKLQLLAVSSSDESSVIERASRRLARAARRVSRMAEQRQRAAALSREHSQLRLAPSRVGGGFGAAGTGGSGTPRSGTGGGGVSGSLVGGSISAAPSRMASLRSLHLTDAQIARAEAAVAGAAVGAGTAPAVSGAAAPELGRPATGGGLQPSSSLGSRGRGPAAGGGGGGRHTPTDRAGSLRAASALELSGRLGLQERAKAVAQWRNASASSLAEDSAGSGSSGGGGGGGARGSPRRAMASPRTTGGAGRLSRTSPFPPERPLLRRSLQDTRSEAHAAFGGGGEGQPTSATAASEPDTTATAAAAAAAAAGEAGGSGGGNGVEVSHVQLSADGSVDGGRAPLMPAHSARSDDPGETHGGSTGGFGGGGGGDGNGSPAGNVSARSDGLPPMERAESPVQAARVSRRRAAAAAAASRLRSAPRSGDGSGGEGGGGGTRARRRRGRSGSGEAQAAGINGDGGSAVLHERLSRAVAQHQRRSGSGARRRPPAPAAHPAVAPPPPPLLRQPTASGGGGGGPAGAGGSGQKRAARHWRTVRIAFETGRLLRIPYDADNYSIVTSTFKRLFPRDFDYAIPVINHKEVDELLMRWEAAVARLERAELTLRRTGREPVKRVGCCGRQRVQVIPQLQEEILELEQQIEAARRRAWASNFTPSWFVFFKSQAAAAMAASTQIYGEDTARFQVHPAPGPEEVNWQHLWLTWRQRDLRTVLTWPLLLLVVFFPITGVTSAVARLQYVLCPTNTGTGALGSGPGKALWPWYCDDSSVVASFFRSLVTGWLPALLLNLWLVLVLPRLVYLLVQSEGSSFSLSALERRIGSVFFYWDVFNVFLQGIIGSAFFQQITAIIYRPQNLPQILGVSLPDSSNFFIQFIAMRAFFLVWLRMCVPHGGVWQNWCHYLCCPACCCSFCNTDRDTSLTYGPRTPRYGFEMGHVLLIYLLSLTFSIVAPLLLPFSVVWFVFAWVQWRHNLCYVYQRKYESGGLMWTYVFSRICICLVIMQLFTFCVLAVKGAFVQAFLIVAFMPALTIKFHRSCRRRFGRGVENVPLQLASRAPRARVPPLVYVPPPLQEKSWGWYPEWNKIWDGWGMPTGYQIPTHRKYARGATPAPAAAPTANAKAKQSV